MIIFLIQLFFPNYYRLVWNAEFKKQMEELRLELYVEFPEHRDLVDKRIGEAYERRLK